MTAEKKRIESLQGMPIFGGIRGEMLGLLLNTAETISISDGQFFFHEGDKADSMFVLEAGAVSVLKSWNGRQYHIGELGAGDCFGEMALLDLFPRSASVLATSDCTAIALSSDGIYHLYEKDLEQFALIQMNIAREISRRLRLINERMFELRMGEPFSEIKDLPPIA